VYAGSPPLAHSPVHKYFNCAAIWRPTKICRRHQAITADKAQLFCPLLILMQLRICSGTASIESVIIADRWWVWAFFLVIQNNKQVKFTYEGQSYKLVVCGILKKYKYINIYLSFIFLQCSLHLMFNDVFFFYLLHFNTSCFTETNDIWVC